MKINPNSPTHLSILFFGGKIKVTNNVSYIDEKGQTILIKSGINKGKIKTKKEESEIYIEGLGLKPHKDWVTKREGIYSTNEAVLRIIAKKSDTDAGKIAALMLEIRGLEKELSTYYIGTVKFIHDHDGCIHPQFSHCGYEREPGDIGGGTNTGRLSCTKPNMQQIPRGE
jgi:DNA polymerase I-like protein with 3'-5' exonuclease and polymerase domains